MAWKINAISSALFAGKQVGNVETQENGAVRVPLLAGQTVSAGKNARIVCAGCGNGLAKGVFSMVDSFEKTCKDGAGFLAGTARVVNFISDNINPIICATSAVQVMMAENQEETFAEKSAGLACMFPAEYLVKEAVGGKGEEFAYKIYELVKTGAEKSTKSVTSLPFKFEGV